jgi:hypothetical protein
MIPGAATRMAVAALVLAATACRREREGSAPASPSASASGPAAASASVSGSDSASGSASGSDSAPPPPPPPPPAPAPAPAPAPSLPLAPAASGPRSADYLEARRRARAWLDALEVDPVELLKHGVKGKKKLGEILDVYWGLFEHASDAADREGIRRRVADLARQAARPEYHDLLALTDPEFTQNSMSYLRVAWLLSRFGLDTRGYLDEIRRVQPRLDAHLRTRGPWQRAMFAEYYDRFGLAKPAFLAAAPLAQGVIARRVPAVAYDDNATYDLTHEVFVAFDYGARRTQSQLSAVDVAYAGEVLPELVRRYVAARNPDLVGELASCMTYLGLGSHPVHRQALDYLLDAQNPNGSWGDYEAHRQRFGPYLEHHVYLHTTMVALDALMAAYQGGWGPGPQPPQ